LRSSKGITGADLIGEGIRFECQACGSCCGGGEGYVFITAREGERIAAFLGMEKDDFYRTMTREAPGRTSLVDGRKGDCCFLEERRCLIYPVRPYQCRSFPFWLNNLRSEKNWKSVGHDCPGCGRGRLHSLEEILRWIEENPFLVSMEQPADPR